MPAPFFVAVKALVRDADGRLLLIRDPERGWELPGGSVEQREDLISALHREVREETGVEIEVGRLGGVYSGMNRTPMIFFYFHATYRSGVLRPSDESPELGWFHLEEARARITMPVVLDRLDELASGTEGPFYAATLGGWSGRPYQVLVRRKI
jgi:ADP-ribose pyrophosphatase YjhB (NUDIX family)